MSNILKLGIPKGSLEKATIELFDKSGWRIKLSSRNYFPEVDDDELSCSICRAQEMSRYVENGILDAGITGKDWILENESDVVVVADLVYSKVSKRPTRWVLAVPGNSTICAVKDLEGKKIATELVNFTKKFFKEQGVNVDVEFSWGATEGKVVSGLADAIVEVTETETTIRAHGLRIIQDLMTSNTQLIANKQAWEDPWKREKITNMALLLQGALRADKIVGLKMNVPNNALDAVICPVAQPQCPDGGAAVSEGVVFGGDRYFRARGARSHSAAAESRGRRNCRVFAEQGHLMIVNQVSFEESVYKESQLPEGELPEVAFAGRSNVGKSSLINKLINRRNLVKVSARPGKTQALNFFLVNGNCYFVDLPGYGFAKVPKKMQQEWQGLIGSYLENRRNLRCVVVIVDIRHAMKVQDYELIDWLRSKRISVTWWSIPRSTN